MFPNIDNKLGLTAVKKALNTRENKSPSMTCILEAVKICLKSNHSVFKEDFFRKNFRTGPYFIMHAFLIINICGPLFFETMHIPKSTEYIHQ